MVDITPIGETKVGIHETKVTGMNAVGVGIKQTVDTQLMETKDHITGLITTEITAVNTA